MYAEPPRGKQSHRRKEILMIRDFSKVLTGLDGQPLKDGDKEIPLSVVCVNALRGVYRGEEDLSGVEKEKRYKLCERIYEQGEVEISIEELALIKNLVGKGYPVDIVGPAYALLESE